MKFAAVALVVAASVATSSAQVVSNACVTAVFKPWISSPNVTTCTTDITPYKMYPAFLPNATTYALFCKSKACEQVVYNTLATRPVEGECYYTVAGTKVNFYATLVDDAVKVCGFTPPTPAPTTVTPVPTTTAPPPTTTAPPPTTTAPATTAPATTAPATTAPATTRPACA